MENVTFKTIELTDKYFAASEREPALSLIMEVCENNLPFFKLASLTDLERVRFAVIKSAIENKDPYAVQETEGP